MGREFFKSQIGVDHESFKEIRGGSLLFPVPNRGWVMYIGRKIRGWTTQNYPPHSRTPPNGPTQELNQCSLVFK